MEMEQGGLPFTGPVGEDMLGKQKKTYIREGIVSSGRVR